MVPGGVFLTFIIKKKKSYKHIKQIKMKKFGIIIMNMGIAFILTLIATGIILFFENEGIEISDWGERFIGFSVGIYCIGKIYYELNSN